MTKRRPVDIGKRVNRLIVLESGITINGKRYYAKTLCDCGNIKFIHEDSIRAGKINSCGCFSKEATRKSNKSKANPNYQIEGASSWKAMMARCYNKNNNQFPNYGARGITVCERWQIIDNFIHDMGARPDGMTLDRINGDGNYEPSNCRWLSQKGQQNNKRNNRFVVFKEEKITIHEARKLLNSSLKGVERIIEHRGCSLQEAFDLYIIHLSTGKKRIDYDNLS